MHSLSAPYLDLHAAFVVPDYMHDLDSIAKLVEQRNLTIGPRDLSRWTEHLWEDHRKHHGRPRGAAARTAWAWPRRPTNHR